ncbi:MAG: type II secretion system F family protein [Armatimonadetes bacterium]|nr:type II secretion system F family protein [Armatimonadota bacterium]
MPVYTFEAQGTDGKTVKGNMEANTQQEAEAMLLARGDLAWLLSLKKQVELFEAEEKVTIPAHFSTGDMVTFCYQMSALFGAGLSVTSIFYTLRRSLVKKSLVALVDDLNQRIQQGKSFAEAFGSHPNLFSPFFVNMVKTGERSGNLDGVFQRLSLFYKKIHEIKRKIKAALAYPIFVIVIAFSVFFLATTLLLPKFDALYKTLNVKLPLQTQMLLDVSRFMTHYWFVIVGGLVILGVVFVVMLKNPDFVKILDKISLRLPVFGALLKLYNSALFTRSFGILVNAGILAFEALDMVAQVVSSHTFKEVILGTSDEVRKGSMFSAGLRKAQMLPPIAEQMIVTGEETGKLPELLDKAASYLEEELDYAVERMTAFLEPALILIVGGGVGFLVVSLYLPLFNLARVIK